MMSVLRAGRLTLAVLMTCCVIAGCGGKPGTSAPGPDQPKEKPGKPKIALIMKSLANEFFLTMENGAKEHQKQNADKYDLIAEGIKDEGDVSRQVNLVEQMVASGVNAIVIAPADSKALVPVCCRAIEAGVTVVNIDNKFDVQVVKDKGVRIPFVGPDNRKGAKMVGDYLAKQLAPGSPVALINGLAGAFNGIQRQAGYEDAMKEAGMTIVASQAGDWEIAKANQVVSALITEKPEIKAFLCGNDSMALGAVSALRSAGKLADVKVVGYDGISAAEELVKKGEMTATAAQHADRLAVFGIEYALQILGGGAPEDKETPVDLVTAETVNK